VDPTSGWAVDPPSHAPTLDDDTAAQGASRVTRGLHRLLRALAKHPTALSIQRAELAATPARVDAVTIDHGPTAP